MPSLRKISLGSADEQLLRCHWTICDSRLNLLLFKARVLAAESEFYGCWRCEWEGAKSSSKGLSRLLELSILVVLVLALSHCLQQGLLRRLPHTESTVKCHVHHGNAHIDTYSRPSPVTMLWQLAQSPSRHL
jgi:hypothetical protein